MNFDKTLSALNESWCIESSSRYEKENPAKGQCSVTAIVVQRMFGGDILKTKFQNCWHFYNRIENSVIDFTSQQFDEAIVYTNVKSSAHEALTDCTELQVAALWRRFKTSLNKN